MTQVDATHYAFTRYETAERFTSYYHQMCGILALQPSSLLEIGVGGGTLLAMARAHGIHAVGMDIDIALQPTLCGSVLAMPLRDAAVDVAAAFQVLEHLPFVQFTPALRELARVSRNGVVISLPEFGNAGLVLSLPFVRKWRWAWRAVPWRPRHRFDGQHYWELNKRGFARPRILAAAAEAGLACRRTWINPFNPYHRFFVLTKDGSSAVVGEDAAA